MATGTRSTPEEAPEVEPAESPEISACESCPGKTVYFERGNTDGWLASDMSVDVVR